MEIERAYCDLDFGASKRPLKVRQGITLILLFAVSVVIFVDRASLMRGEHYSECGKRIGPLLSAFSLTYGFSWLLLIAVVERFGTERWEQDWDCGRPRRC